MPKNKPTFSILNAKISFRLIKSIEIEINVLHEAFCQKKIILYEFNGMSVLSHPSTTYTTTHLLYVHTFYVLRAPIQIFHQKKERIHWKKKKTTTKSPNSHNTDYIQPQNWHARAHIQSHTNIASIYTRPTQTHNSVNEPRKITVRTHLLLLVCIVRLLRKSYSTVLIRISHRTKNTQTRK